MSEPRPIDPADVDGDHGNDNYPTEADRADWLKQITDASLATAREYLRHTSCPGPAVGRVVSAR